MDHNSVHLIGRVKRSAEAGTSRSNRVLDFAVEVEGDRGRRNIFDCRITSASAAFGELDGFVNEGEHIEIIGHLNKQTVTEGARINGVWVEVRNTQTIVFVDDVVTED